MSALAQSGAAFDGDTPDVLTLVRVDVTAPPPNAGSGPPSPPLPGGSAGTRDPLCGRTLGERYAVGRRIARGGMATVYEATDTRLGRPVAIKVMHQAFAEDAEFVRRFQREARSAAALSHPNVVAVFDQGLDPQIGLAYLTMEYVRGRTLRELIVEQGPLDPAAALAILDPVLDALGAAHAAGLVHRDIKPENVLLGTDGAIKVADFGLARAVSTTSTATQGLLIGTVSYLAPEQLTTGDTDARTDVYAAGIVLFEMLTGRKPHEGESPIQVAYAHVNADVPEPSQLVPGVPRFVDGLVVRSTSRDPDVRPADARVFLHHVRRARMAIAQGSDDPALTEDLYGFRRTPVDDRSGNPEDPDDETGGDGRERTTVAPFDPAELATLQAAGPGRDTVGRWARGDDGRLDSRRGSGGPSGPGGSGGHGAHAAHGSPSAYGPNRGEGTSRLTRRGLLAVGLAVVLLLGVAGAGWWYAFGRYTSVPAVVDSSRAQLQDIARTTGLHFRVAGRTWDDAIATGHVVRSSPAPGAQVRRAGTVEVWLSLGRERHPVPKLAGRTEAAARALLAAVRLRVGGVEQVYRDDVPSGQVVSVTPAAGTVLTKGTGVRLTVSRGPAPVQIPAVVNQSLDQAKATLQNLGLEVTTTQAYSDTVPRGQVSDQQPGAGLGHRGDRVRLTVSQGPEFLAVPNVRGANVDAATKQLKDLGFQVKVERNALYAGIGAVVDQNPAADARVHAGTTVVLQIV